MEPLPFPFRVSRRREKSPEKLTGEVRLALGRARERACAIRRANRAAAKRAPAGAGARAGYARNRDPKAGGRRWWLSAERKE